MDRPNFKAGDFHSDHVCTKSTGRPTWLCLHATFSEYWKSFGVDEVGRNANRVGGVFD